MIRISGGRITTVTLISVEIKRYILVTIDGIDSFFVIQHFISDRFTKLVCNSRIVAITFSFILLLENNLGKIEHLR